MPPHANPSFLATHYSPSSPPSPQSVCAAVVKMVKAEHKDEASTFTAFHTEEKVMGSFAGMIPESGECAALITECISVLFFCYLFCKLALWLVGDTRVYHVCLLCVCVAGVRLVVAGFIGENIGDDYAKLYSKVRTSPCVPVTITLTSRHHNMYQHLALHIYPSINLTCMSMYWCALSPLHLQPDSDAVPEAEDCKLLGVWSSTQNKAKKYFNRGQSRFL